jgi:hypothetical protein
MSTVAQARASRAADNCKPPQAGHIESQVVEITPEQAQGWLDSHQFEGQRSVTEWRVDLYAKAMQAGKFEATAIKFHHLGQVAFLTDGQHRLHAIVRAGVPVKLIVVREWVRTYEDIREAYGHIDMGKARTTADALKATGLATRLGLNERQVNAAGTAMRVLAVSFNRAAVQGGRDGLTADEIARGIELWRDEIKAYFECIEPAKGTTRKGLHEGTVVAVALITFRYQRELAQDFWFLVAANDQLKRNTGPWWVVDIISQTHRKRDLRDYARRLSSCWRAHWHASRGLKGGEITSTLVRDVTRPIDLDGCSPYNGESHVRLEL